MPEYTQDFIDTVLRYYENCGSGACLKKFNLSRATLHFWVRKAKIVSKHSKSHHDLSLKEKIISIHLEKGFREVRKLYPNLPKSTIFNWMYKENYTSPEQKIAKALLSLLESSK